MNILIFIIILLLLVLVHEFGHFWTAKKFGIRVDEFGFGFPPKAMTLFKKGETEYTLNWLPIGGFVKIFGENPDDENTNGVDRDRSFVHKPKWQQAIVLVAGIAANLLLAWVLFSVGFMSGLPTAVESVSDGAKLQDQNLVITSVRKDSPAEKAGLVPGDRLLDIHKPLSVEEKKFYSTASKAIPSPQQVTEFVRNHPNQEVEVEYYRSTEGLLTTILVPVSVDNQSAFIGISMAEIGILKLPFFSALVEGAKFTWNVTEGTVVGLYGIIKSAVTGAGNVKDSITGPVGMVGIVGDAYQFGFAYLLSFAALISVNLAVINLIPFPALDGGRLFFLLIEKIKGSRLNPNVANVANMVGFWLLILLMLFVTYNDIVKLI